MTTSRPNDESGEKLPATSDFKELYQMTSRTRPVAANDNVLPVTLPNNLRTALCRSEAVRLATKLIAANDNAPLKGREPVFRGGRPAFNWAAKNDKLGAACLWLIARQRLPESVVAANDNEPSQGGLDAGKNGSARGRQKVKASLGKHLDLPAVLPRLGDAQPQPVATCGYTRLDISPQNDMDELSDDFLSFGSCSDGVASLGIDFIGAESGLGTPRCQSAPNIPCLNTCNNTENEAEVVGTWIAERLRKGCQPHEIGVFVRSDAELTRARAALKIAGARSIELNDKVEVEDGSIAISTMHFAKGLEFRSVVVMACDDEVIPLQERIESVADDADLEEVYDTERHLLYVACTRARDHLLVTGVEPVSEFLDDLVKGDQRLPG
jgi:hypothetical protein